MNMNAKWITINELPDKTSLYIFRKKFTYLKEAERFQIEISADSRYRLYINGTFLADGPCMGGEYTQYYEELDAAKALVVGENKIEVRVMHAVGESFMSVWRKERPALFFHGVIDGKTEIGSDSSFTCERVDSHEFYVCKEIQASVASFEKLLGDYAATKMTVKEWFTPHLENGCVNPNGGVCNPYVMEKRPIPQICAQAPKSLSVVREYEESDGTYNIILDAGSYTTSMVQCDFQAPVGTTIYLSYAECMTFRDENGKVVKGMRDAADGTIERMAYDTLIANGKHQTFETFWYRAFRFIRVECDCKPEELYITHSRYTYDFLKNAEHSGIGSFESNETIYSDMWRVSRNTLECSSQEIFMDCPYYEQQQYAMDGGLESLFAWRLTNDSSLQRKIIIDMAHSQRPNGLIQASYPSRYRQIIPSFSLYYVMLHREYLRYTGDTAFVRSYISVCDRILDAFEGMLDENGLVLPNIGWCYLDWVKTWKIGTPTGGDKAPITVYSMLYAVALRYQAEVCEACGRTGLAAEYRVRRDQMIRSINEHCFDREEGMYIDVFGRRAFSWHTTVWAVLSGCVTGEQARALMDRTMQRRDIPVCSFSMNFYLLRALETTGLYEKYAPSILQGWHTMLDLHCTTWCESIALPRSECHGWSSTPMYEMSAMLLGVYPMGDGFEKVRIKPVTLGLTEASGRVPTPFGYIDVAWKMTGETMTLSVTASRKIEMEIILPSAKQEIFCGNSVTIEG